MLLIPAQLGCLLSQSNLGLVNNPFFLILTLNIEAHISFRYRLVSNEHITNFTIILCISYNLCWGSVCGATLGKIKIPKMCIIEKYDKKYEKPDYKHI